MVEESFKVLKAAYRNLALFLWLSMLALLAALVAGGWDILSNDSALSLPFTDTTLPLKLLLPVMLLASSGLLLRAVFAANFVNSKTGMQGGSICDHNREYIEALDHFSWYPLGMLRFVNHKLVGANRLINDWREELANKPLLFVKRETYFNYSIPRMALLFVRYSALKVVLSVIAFLLYVLGTTVDVMRSFASVWDVSIPFLILIAFNMALLTDLAAEYVSYLALLLLQFALACSLGIVVAGRRGVARFLNPIRSLTNALISMVRLQDALTAWGPDRSMLLDKIVRHECSISWLCTIGYHPLTIAKAVCFLDGGAGQEGKGGAHFVDNQKNEPHVVRVMARKHPLMDPYPKLTVRYGPDWLKAMNKLDTWELICALLTEGDSDILLTLRPYELIYHNKPEELGQPAIRWRYEEVMKALDTLSPTTLSDTLNSANSTE